MGLLKIFSRRSGRDTPKQDLRQNASQQSIRPASSNAVGLLMYPSNVQARVSTVSLRRVEEVDMGNTLPPFRRVLDNDRPESADSFRSGASGASLASGRPRAQRPKREPRKPPVSFRKPSTLSLNQSASSQEEPMPLKGTVSDAGSVRQSLHRAGSISSLQRRLSTDLLDAVDQFRPLDFRSRVEAAGARDYGEDVADRNITRSKTMSTLDHYSQHNFTDRSMSAQSGGPGHLRSRSRTESVNTLDYQYESTSRENPSSAIFGNPVSFSRKNKMRLSLNTYKPSGLRSPALHSPRSAVTTPGHRGGMTPKDFEFPNVDSPLVEPEEWSRNYHMSPTSSNFSISRSSMGNRHPVPQLDKQQREPVEEASNLVYERESDCDHTAYHSIRPGPNATGVHVPITTPTEIHRSSMVSSISSRKMSVDFQPLGYPSVQGFRNMGSKGLIEKDDDPGQIEGPPSIRVKMQSRPSSSDGSQGHQRTRSSHTVPSGLNDLFKIDEQTIPERSSVTHDWVLVTPSNESTCSSSNGLFSSTSGSGRPTSRHTKATSTDSNSRPRSSQSYISTSLGQGGSEATWSPITPRSAGFNIDDYISSDDDSFNTEKRPSGEGEEELLFKDKEGYGVMGGALPGLSTSMSDACVPPDPGYRISQVELPDTRQDKEISDDDPDAAAAPTIEHARYGEPRSRCSPSRRLSHTRSSPDYDLFSTFGRRVATRPRASSNRTPSWLPSDDWAQPAQSKRLTMLSTIHNGLYDVEEVKARSRGQTRLSALGMPSGRKLESTVPMINTHKRVISSSSSSSSSSKSSKKVLQKQPVASPIEKEVTPAVSARLRREAKARERENEAQAILQKRLERTSGRSGEEMSAWARAPLAEADRGRTRTRGGKENAMLVG